MKSIFLLFAALLILFAPAVAQKVAIIETSTGIDFLIGQNHVLSYQTAMLDVPEGVKKEFRKSGFIHPLKSPSGEVLTRIQPPDHYHHLGIWGPWTKTKVEGREVDFWNLGDGKGRVDFDHVISQVNKGNYAELVVRQNHTDLLAPNGPQVAIEEDLGIRVQSADKRRYMVDYTTTISTPLKSSIMLEAYRYGGGIGYRATEAWDQGNSTILTSEGYDRTNADGTGGKWVMVHGATGDKSGTSGILFLSHPENQSHPEPMRVWPIDANGGKENVYIEFCPIRYEPWEIEPENKYTLKYRMVVFDGTLTADEAEAYWKAFIRK